MPPAATLAALMLTSLAWSFAIRATSGLHWPPEGDLLRDVAAARALLNGRFPEDPAYLGEVWWYNPLVPGLVALLASTSGWSLEALYTHGGVYLNLLVPLAFYVFAQRLIGRWPAVASLLAFLFLFDPALGSMHKATYSPWLFPYNFVQALAFATLWTWQRVEQRPTQAGYLKVGLLLGLTFLGHTAPAIILGVAVVGANLVITLRRHATWSVSVRRVLSISVVAVFVSLLFIVPILVRYRFRILHPAPGSLALLGGGALITDLASPRGIMTLSGAWFFAQRLARPGSDHLLPFAATLVSAFVLFAFSLVAQRLGWTGIVPSFHFHLYLTSLGAVLFGQAVDGVAAQVHRWIGRPRSAATGPRLIAALLIAVLVFRLPAYATCVELTAMRASSLLVARNFSATRLYGWLTEQPRRGSVLTTIGSSLWVAAAGHPVVLAFPTYSNPYVSFEARERTANELSSAWQRGDAASFLSQAHGNRVSYVITEGDGPPPTSPTIVQVFEARNGITPPGAEPFRSYRYDGFPPVPFMQRVRVYRVVPADASSRAAR